MRPASEAGHRVCILVARQVHELPAELLVVPDAAASGVCADG
jgi:hypothetical protein